METWLMKSKVMPNNVFAELPNTYTLSEQEKQFYDQNGYLVIKELIDFGTLYSCKQRFSQICKNVVKSSRGDMVIFVEPSMQGKGLKGEALVNKVQEILYDEIFSLYTENPRLLHVVSQFIGPNVMGIHSMMINKPPGTGRHPPHQDMYYFPIRPVDKIVGVWTAVDEAREDNGCLLVRPGSHRGELYAHAHPPDASKLYHGVEEDIAPAETLVPVEMSPGDTIFLHPLLVHGSGPNVTSGYRKSISCHYASCQCEYVQPDGVQTRMAKEIEELMRKHGVEDPSLIDFYRYVKTKLVLGTRSRL